LAKMIRPFTVSLPETVSVYEITANYFHTTIFNISESPITFSFAKGYSVVENNIDVLKNMLSKTAEVDYNYQYIKDTLIKQQGKLDDLIEEMGKAQNAELSRVSPKVLVGAGVVTCIFAAIMIYSLVSAVKDYKKAEEEKKAREEAPYEYPIAIPERMCWAKDTVETDTNGISTTVTDYFFYNVVKNAEGTNWDIFAKTQKQWMALYSTTDWGCGYPILANTLTISTGSSIAPEGRDKAVHIFGQKNNYAQNLQDSETLKITEENGNDGFYIFYSCYKPVGTSGASIFSDNLPLSICLICVCGLAVVGTVLLVKKKKKKTEVQ